MAFPDGEQLGTKLGAAGIAYASYWGAPSATPNPGQIALCKEFVNGLGVTNRYLTILAQLNGMTDATPYAEVKAWLDAREPELIKLFGLGQ